MRLDDTAAVRSSPDENAPFARVRFQRGAFTAPVDYGQDKGNANVIPTQTNGAGLFSI